MEHYNGEVDNGNGNYGLSSDEKGLSVLAYIGCLFFIPLLVRPNSKFCKFHANQGLVLFIMGYLVSFALKFVPFVHGILAMVWGLFTLALMIIGIINAVNGQMKDLPLIGSIHLIK